MFCGTFMEIFGVIDEAKFLADGIEILGEGIVGIVEEINGLTEDTKDGEAEEGTTFNIVEAVFTAGEQIIGTLTLMIAINYPPSAPGSPPPPATKTLLLINASN